VSDVVLGGLLAIAGGLVGGIGGVLVQGHLNREAERRAEDRARTDRLREFRADSLQTAYRLFLALGEHARGLTAGESPEQIARLRTQIESTANVGGDARLFGREGIDVVQGFIQSIMKLLEAPPGSGITLDQVAEIVAWESKLGALYVEAMQRILSESVPSSR
jgi:hypothetical protein